MSLQLEHTILLVDDEQPVVRSLQRLFRKEKYRILTAFSGRDALETILNSDKNISLIISDQRMTDMMGAQFLEKAKTLVPDAIRFLLTGYSDYKDLMDAINKGEIHRYITKPWNDDDLMFQVQKSLEEYELKAENRRLNELTSRQNTELIALNSDLENKIQERTNDIVMKSLALEEANASLERGFLDTIRLLSSLVETLNPKLGSYLSFVGQLSRQIGQELQLDNAELDQIEIAGLIHDIGLLGLPQNMTVKDENDMTDSELTTYKQHPMIGQICLQPVERLDTVGEIIFTHHENFDGTGFPNGIRRDMIPLGARIVHAAADYSMVLRKWPENIAEIRRLTIRYLGHSAQNIDTDDPRVLQTEVAKLILNRWSRSKYDPDIVKKLIYILQKEQDERGTIDEDFFSTQTLSVSLKYLKPGMTLAKEIRTLDGRLLLLRGTVLDDSLISTVRKLNETVQFDGRLEIVVE